MRLRTLLTLIAGVALLAGWTVPTAADTVASGDEHSAFFASLDRTCSTSSDLEQPQAPAELPSDVPEPEQLTCEVSEDCPDGSEVSCSGTTCSSGNSCSVICDGVRTWCCDVQLPCNRPCAYCNCLAIGGTPSSCYDLSCPLIP